MHVGQRVLALLVTLFLPGAVSTSAQGAQKTDVFMVIDPAATDAVLRGAKGLALTKKLARVQELLGSDEHHFRFSDPATRHILIASNDSPRCDLPDSTCVALKVTVTETSEGGLHVKLGSFEAAGKSAPVVTTSDSFEHLAASVLGAAANVSGSAVGSIGPCRLTRSGSASTTDPVYPICERLDTKYTGLTDASTCWDRAVRWFLLESERVQIKEPSSLRNRRIESIDFKAISAATGINDSFELQLQTSGVTLKTGTLRGSVSGGSCDINLADESGPARSQPSSLEGSYMRVLPGCVYPSAKMFLGMALGADQPEGGTKLQCTNSTLIVASNGTLSVSNLKGSSQIHARSAESQCLNVSDSDFVTYRSCESVTAGDEIRYKVKAVKVQLPEIVWRYLKDDALSASFGSTSCTRNHDLFECPGSSDLVDDCAAVGVKVDLQVPRCAK